MSFRCREILVTTPIYDALQALAEVQGLDCPDAAAEVILGQHLDGPAFRWNVSRRKADTQKRKEEFMQKMQEMKPKEEEDTL